MGLIANEVSHIRRMIVIEPGSGTIVILVMGTTLVLIWNHVTLVHIILSIASFFWVGPVFSWSHSPRIYPTMATADISLN